MLLMLEDEKMPNEEVSPRKQQRKNNFIKVLELVYNEAKNPGNLNSITGTEHQCLFLYNLMYSYLNIR